MSLPTMEAAVDCIYKQGMSRRRRLLGIRTPAFHTALHNFGVLTSVARCLSGRRNSPRPLNVVHAPALDYSSSYGEAIRSVLLGIIAQLSDQKVFLGDNCSRRAFRARPRFLTLRRHRSDRQSGTVLTHGGSPKKHTAKLWHGSEFPGCVLILGAWLASATTFFSHALVAIT